MSLGAGQQPKLTAIHHVTITWLVGLCRLVHELTRERVNEELQALRAAAAEEAEVAAVSRVEAEAKASKERVAAAEADRLEQAAKRAMVAEYKCVEELLKAA